MTDTQGTQNLSPEERQAQINKWNQDEMVKVQKFCFSQGLQMNSIDQKKTLCLPPVMGVWFIKAKSPKQNYWIISGDFPTDITKADVAANAREALRHFSMSWQLKAARLQDDLAAGQRPTLSDRETQEKFANTLIAKAEMLYDIFTNDELWAGAGL
ncbi:MAG: DUF4826 family protein [Gammaproteobacteria bacterium]|nr:DUF4826 family protein [Gammaproteobacteria bacterium]MDH5629413.1 DUF4826 family protein [Gammaproteobacteria bacterium]